MLTREHVVKRLLESLASLRFRPERFVIINNAIGISPGLACVADNLTGNFSIGVNPHIDRPHQYARRQITLYLFMLFFAKILRDLQRHDSAVAVVTKDRLVRNSKLSAE